MYKLCDGKVIRYCGNKAFVIDIYSNNVLTLSKEAMDFFVCNIFDLNEEIDIQTYDKRIIDLFNYMLRNHIIEEKSHEV